jgi:hypothetical protein
MRTHYEPQRRPPQRREHFEPSAARDRYQDDRDAYGEFPGQIGDDYDDAERRFGNDRRPGVPYERAPSRERWKPSDSQRREASTNAHAERQDSAHGFRGRGPRGYTRSDERIREEVCERLTDEDVDVGDVEVSVSGGEVTLTGTVRDRRTKREVEAIVDGVSGVTDVANQLRLKGASQAEAKDPLSSIGEERKSDREDRKPDDDTETSMP